MEFSRRWGVGIITVYLFQSTTILCQNGSPGSGSAIVRDNREISRLSGNQGSHDNYNTLASSNGVSFNDLARSLSAAPIEYFGYVYPQDPLISRGQPITSQPFSNQDPIYANLVPPVPSCTSNPIEPLVVLSQPNYVSQIAQTLPPENYPTCAQNVGAARPMHIALQPQSQFNEDNPYNVYNQILESMPLEANTQPLNLPSSSQILPATKTSSGHLARTPDLESRCVPPTELWNDEKQLPINLKINVFTPNSPTMTAVPSTSTNTALAAASCTNSAYFPSFVPPQTPIVFERPKSSLRNLLPILLAALLSDGNKRCGCCCSTCNCCNANMPVPYLIPVPNMTPIVNVNVTNTHTN